MVTSLVWFMWYYTGDKLKELLKPIPTEDKDIYWDIINTYKAKITEVIWLDETLSLEEKIEQNLEQIADIDTQAVEEEEEFLETARGAEVRKDIITNRVIAGVMLLIDTLLILIPAFLLASGYMNASLAAFGVLGVIGGLTVTKKVQEQGVEVGLLKNISIILAYLLTQIPYFTIMFTGWAF